MASAASPPASGRAHTCWHSSTCGRNHATAKPHARHRPTIKAAAAAQARQPARQASAAEARQSAPAVASPVIHAAATSCGIDHGDIHQLSHGSNAGQLLHTTAPCRPSGSWLTAITSSLE
eukprot:scaffold2187_cov109-Isochrysis_galbana.AAC.7